MDKSPKVSVCIPVYNRPDFIGEAIESALAQTHEDYELIITDNCSTDETPDIIEKYVRQDSRIIFHRNKCNLGVAGNLNQAILLSQGEYIKFIFSDDKIAPQCLEVFINILDSHPKVSLVTSYTQNIGDDDHIRDKSFFPGTGELDGKFAQKDLLISGNWPGSPSSTMFRRRDLYIGMFRHAWDWLGDLEMWLRLLGVGNAYVVPQILSYTRIHDKQESTIHAVDFRLIKERLMLTNIAFQFPQTYGDYTKAEQKAIHSHLLKRLVREGIGQRGLKPKVDMTKIGMSQLCHSKIDFWWILTKNLPRIFRESRFSQD
jgi:glycosyltransferase involved in cell wall biosynthesis